MNMEQLARLAGVSVSTISKAFSGSHEISEAKREEIFRLAKENGCYDKYARLQFPKKVVAVICPEYQSGYYCRQLTSFEEEIKKHGGIMIAASYQYHRENARELLSYFTEYIKVDGVISYDAYVPSGKYHTPIVVIGKNEHFDSVSLSHHQAISDAVKHFAENGHRKIAYIGEKQTVSKKEDFLDAMKAQGLSVRQEYIIERQERFEEAGYRAMNILLDQKEPPTAVLAAYDNIAFGMMHSIFEHGLSIPEDISLIGMDDNRIIPYLNVPLSSVTSYHRDLCEIVVEMLFERIEKGNSGKRKKVKVVSELVKRGSVGKIETDV